MFRFTCYLFVLSLITCLPNCADSLADDKTPTNIVLIMADDLGRECLECYGGESYRTPNLNTLAESGTRFECCYATPMCSPTRVLLMTGKYNFRNYTQWARMDFPEPSLAKELKRVGYETAIFGKWHLGGWDSKPYGPTRVGFDHFATFDYETVVREGGEIGNQFWKTEVWEDGKNFRLGNHQQLTAYGPAYYREHAVEWIRTQSQNQAKPFFLYYPLALAHRPFVPSDLVKATDAERNVRNGELKNFPEMVTYIDNIVGTVLKTLEESNQLENTVVIFTADNGTDAVGEAKELRSLFHGELVPGGKYLPTELGANVPLLIRGPNVVAGRIAKQPVDFADILPTLCDIAGKKPSQRTDGESLWPLLQGASEETHDGLAYTWGVFERSSRKYKQPQKNPKKLIHIVRNDRWKYLSNGDLFDLQTDWRERTPVPVDEEIETRKSMKAALQNIRSGKTLW